jgi:hypothetical protein
MLVIGMVNANVGLRGLDNEIFQTAGNPLKKKGWQ